MRVTGPGVKYGTIISSVGSTSATMSNPAVSSQTAEVYNFHDIDAVDFNPMPVSSTNFSNAAAGGYRGALPGVAINYQLLNELFVGTELRFTHPNGGSISSRITLLTGWSNSNNYIQASPGYTGLNTVSYKHLTLTTPPYV